jgi:hypothetical protein
MIWVEIDKDSIKNSRNTIIGAIYRRPGSDPKDFIDKLTETLNVIECENKHCFHTGDYNLNLLNSSTHPPTSEFIDINFAHSFFPVIKKPTRITSSSATLIDNIFVHSNELLDSKSGILLWDVSDHFPVFFIHYKENQIKEDLFRTGRTLNTTNKAKFTKIINETNWDTVLNDSDTQSSYTAFHNILTKAFDISFPLTKTKITYSNKLTWLTSGMKRSISQKHKLHSSYLKQPSPANKLLYKTFKNKLSHVLK